MRMLLDANVLLRSSQLRHILYLPAQRAIDELLRAGHELLLVPQVLYEYWVVATRPLGENGLGLSVDAVGQRFERFQRIFPLISDEAGVFAAWKTLVQQFGVRGKPAHDTRLVAAMQCHRISHIVTFDTAHFRRYPEVVVIDPLAWNTLSG